MRLVGVRFRSPPAAARLQLPAIRADALAECYDFIERLHREWQEGQTRFDGRGELLIVATVGEDEAAVGGLTIDPAVAGALRLRRFYVRPFYRGRGLGREMAERLVDHARGITRLLTVNAGTEDAARFWLRLGFLPSPTAGITHQRQLR